MNRYLLIRRLRGPAFLLLVGVNAILAQAHILGWGKSWPLYLILAGVLLLAERAALAAEGDWPPNPGAPYGAAPVPGATPAVSQPAASSGGQAETALAPTRPHVSGNDPSGGQS
jgi:hypothetical protein